MTGNSSGLLWPGDERAGDLFTDETFLSAMVAVEEAWLDALAGAGIAPPCVADLDLLARVGPKHHQWLVNESELSGNPAAALVDLLRDGLADLSADGARWVHRGLTSQDVVDTALMLCSQEAMREVVADLRQQVALLVDLVERHRRTGMVARTLTQHAVPTTFGLKAATWLTGVLDAYDAASLLVFPVQVGGAAGTMAATVELAGALADPVSATTALTLEVATALDLAASTPWHTNRSTLTRLGDAAVTCTDAWGRMATDVLTLSRPEIGELSEGFAGGSSTMPHKANPVLATLVRRAALGAPGLAATLHLAASDAGDERPAGAWHVEWDTLRTLLRRTAVAAGQVTELLSGLTVHADRMAETLDAARDPIRSEQRSMAALSGSAGADGEGDYLGITAALLEAPLARAAGVLA
jgi:3-carboxy-cis,cis-muconate cycloisomerase